jgi:hypothetical protein
MNNEPAFSSKRDDIANRNVVAATGSKRQNVTGPHARQHAGTCHANANFAECGQALSNQLGRRILNRTRPHVFRSDQEVFRLVAQGPDVALILPQANAMTSNTVSCRNAGLT